VNEQHDPRSILRRRPGSGAGGGAMQAVAGEEGQAFHISEAAKLTLLSELSLARGWRAGVPCAACSMQG
jgi:hypothetical protein